MRFLTICPSRERPDRLKEMITSFNQTAYLSDLVIYLDSDDPTLERYEETEHETIISERKTTTEIFNKALEDYPDYDFYHLTNDDVIYHTNEWDKRFRDVLVKKEGGICYGNDLLSGGHLPAHPCIFGEYARRVGWLQLPTLKHLYGDTVWKYIGNKLNKLFYLTDVIIEHKTWMNLKAEVDNTYKRTNSQEMYKQDEKAYKYWIQNESENVIRRILGV